MTEEPIVWSREGRWIAILAMVFGWSTIAWSAETPGVPNDRELAGVIVGKDGPLEIEHKLGASPCLVPSSSGETMSYLYHVPGVKGPSFLRLEVNGKVDAITISVDPPLTGVCYAPVHLSSPLRTQKGLHLGLTTEEVTNIYGKPVESFAVGSMMRFRYAGMLDRLYEWDLVFRNGQLVEWSVVTPE